MFEQFREKFHAVQQDFTDGIKTLSAKAQNVGKPNRGPDSTISKRDRLPGLRDGLHLSAGADLLDRFQENWTKIHEDLEGSAKKADETEKVVKRIGVAQQRRLSQWQGIKKQLSDIPAIVEDIQKITATIGTLAADFDEVETLLIELEDVLEEEEQQRNEQVQRQELERYKQQKIYEEGLLKDRLQDEFNEKLQAQQRKEDDKMRERQRAFQDFFDQDLKHYKEFGQVQPTMEVPSPEAHLEDFELEWDEHDQQALDDFLGPSENQDTSPVMTKGPGQLASKSPPPPSSSLPTPDRDEHPEEGPLSKDSKGNIQALEETSDRAAPQVPTDGQMEDSQKDSTEQSLEAETVEARDERPVVVGDGEDLTTPQEEGAVTDDVSKTSDSAKVEIVTVASSSEDIPESAKTEDPSQEEEDSDDFQDAVDE